MIRKLVSILRSLKYFIRRNTYFSETGEDVVLKQFVSKSPGSYVDVGAHHPIIGNNTFGLYLKGWSGVAVEPQTQFNHLWRLFRSRDILSNSPVSKDPRVVFHYFNNSLLNTTNTKVADLHKSEMKWLHSKSVNAIQLQSIFPSRLNPLENFVLSLDIEGSELDALTTLDWKSQKPRIIIVESWEKPWLKSNKVNSFLTEKQYKLQAYTGLSAIFVAQEYLNSNVTLKDRLGENQEREDIE
jgi:FkbM family methyltransferase